MPTKLINEVLRLGYGCVMLTVEVIDCMIYVLSTGTLTYMKIYNTLYFN